MVASQAHRTPKYHRLTRVRPYWLRSRRTDPFGCLVQWKHVSSRRYHRRCHN